MLAHIDIPDQEYAQLNQLSEARNVPVAELFRELVHTYLEKEEPTESDDAVKAAIGIWADRGEDGMAYQDRMRSEWDNRPALTQTS